MAFGAIYKNGHWFPAIAEKIQSRLVSYDNTESEMEADNVQDAVDELKSSLVNQSEAINAITKVHYFYGELSGITIPANSYVSKSLTDFGVTIPSGKTVANITPMAIGTGNRYCNTVVGGGNTVIFSNTASTEYTWSIYVKGIYL